MKACRARQPRVMNAARSAGSLAREVTTLVRCFAQVGRELLSGQPAGMSWVEARTMQVGSLIVLTAVSLGLQLGGWPAWTILGGVLGFVAWTMLYAEVVVRSGRMRPSAAEPEA